MTKAMCSEDSWTDDRPIVRELNLRIEPVGQSQGKRAPTAGCLSLRRIKTARESIHLQPTGCIRFIRLLQRLEDTHLANIKTGLTRMVHMSETS